MDRLSTPRFILYPPPQTPAQDRARIVFDCRATIQRVLSLNAHETKSRHAVKHDG
jgi:hypothetical protein